MEENKERPKTKSKNFYDDEILGVDSDGVVYLKTYVHRLFPPTLTEYDYQNINYTEKIASKLIEANEILKGEKNFD